MALDDPRVLYIQNSGRIALGLDHYQPDPHNQSTNNAIIDFINNYQVNILRLYRTQSSLTHDLIPGADIVQYVKRREGFDIPAVDVHRHILMTTLSGPEGLSISLRHIFSTAQEIDQASFVSLTKSLESHIPIGFSNDKSTNDDETAIWNTLTVDDECQFWRRIRNKSKKSNRADLFLSHLETLNDKVNSDWDCEENIMSVLEESQYIIGELWREDGGSYPQMRITNLIFSISKQIAAFVQKSLSKTIDIWSIGWQDGRQALLTCCRVVDLWLVISHDLYERDFIDRWIGDPIDDHLLTCVSRRLRHIRDVRSLHDELERLIPVSDQQRFSLESVLDPVRLSSALYWSSGSESDWDNALAEFDRIISPIEHHSASLLRSRISSLSSQPNLLLAEFESFPELLSRPIATEELAAEREMLLVKMMGQVQALKSSFEAGYNPLNFIGFKNISEIVNHIIWAIQVNAKTKQMVQIVGRVLYGTSGVERLITQAEEVIANITQFSDDEFQSWTSKISDDLNDPSSSLALQTSGKLLDLDLDHDGDMRVHYNERLVILLREVRALSELGYRIPREIITAADIGDRFYRQAVQLQQVANFYNTMTTQIIPSQKGMMLNEARAFEEAVQCRSATWDSPEQVENYVGLLMKAADQLTTKNRRLRGVHNAIGGQVVMGMCTEVGTAPWLGIVSRIQGMVTAEETGNSPSGMRLWRRHWDQQLFKALSIAYKSSLQSLSLPEQKADMVFANGAIQLRPPLEEIRLTNIRYIHKIVSIPMGFTGLGSGDDSILLFRSLPSSSYSSLLRLFLESEMICSQVQNTILEYQEWAAPGIAEFSSIVETHLQESDPSTIAMNLADIDKRREEMMRSPDSIQIGPITISLIIFKSNLDDMIRRLIDCITNLVRSIITNNYRIIDRFISEASTSLTIRPRSVGEIAIAKSTLSGLIETKSGLITIDEVNDYNQLIYKVEDRIDLVNIRQKWAALDIELLAYTDLLADSTNVCRESISARSKSIVLDIDKFASRWKALCPKNGVVESVDKVKAELVEWRAELGTFCKNITDLLEERKAFNLEPMDIGDSVVKSIDGELSSLERTWQMISDFSSSLAAMADNETWIEFRTHCSDMIDFATTWRHNLKVLSMDNDIIKRIKDDLQRIDNVNQVIRWITGEMFEKEHWSHLLYLLDIPVNIKALRLRHFINASDRLISKSNQLRDLSNRAQSEVMLREAFEEMRIWSERTVFELSERSKSEVPLIKGWKEIMGKVGDQQALLASLRDSPYFGPFSDLATQIAGRLALLDNCLGKLSSIQRRWVYLAPIFSRGALPKEQGRFRKIDDEFRLIMHGIGDNPNVMNLSTIAGLEPQLTSMLDQLERCQKALSDFLELKRSLFPRFYFIGDDALLEILGQSSNPRVVQTHLRKLFQGIHSVGFNNDSTVITSILSVEGEEVPLSKPVPLTEQVDEWLSLLANEMCTTLSACLLSCLNQPDPSITQYPSQILSLSEQIRFSADIEQVLNGRQQHLDTIKQKIQSKLSNLTGSDNRSALEDLKVKSLVMDMVHHLEIISTLEQGGVHSSNHWLWQKQLRFYVEDGVCVGRMCSARFKYSYEYQGNPGRLVHTPLTDKCYLVLTQGMHLGYGGNPYGPAGTGKTESVKALGQCLGRQVLVFNCDEGIDFQSMGRIFTGLVKSGAWGCFDEFNRLKEDQLSAVSQQIQLIQAALKAHDNHVVLLGNSVDVNANAGIFVTMNPAGKEYGGRSRLPDNLKALFRSVAMTIPDNNLIAEVILYSEGFSHAALLGAKLVSIYDLSRQLLSAQKHYDWGLRALKTVLRLGGQLIDQHRRHERSVNGEGVSSLTVQDETCLIVKALSANTLSKLTYTDSVRFISLLGDVFPNTPVDDVQYIELEKALVASIDRLGLQRVPSQVRKALQVYEALNQRIGVVIVGPSGSGKSTLLQILFNALSSIGKPIHRSILNPKALDRRRLLGRMDPDTREWFDGVLTKAAREVIESGPDEHHWVICDGDVDPEWIESLNSVLDDNHLLTMPNGERIQFGNTVNFIFESDDLEHASPATISRMGMVLVNNEDSDLYKAIISSWRSTIKERSIVSECVDDILYPAIEYVKGLPKSAMIVPKTLTGLIKTALSHLSSIKTRSEFAINLVHGLGGNMSKDGQHSLARNIFKWAQVPDLSPLTPLDLYWDAKKGSVQRFAADSIELDIGSVACQDPPSIRTVDVQRNLATISPWITKGESFLVVGPQGCGKTYLVRSALSAHSISQYVILHCSAHTRAVHVIQKLRDSCTMVQGVNGRCIRPARGDRLLLFLKDINLPRPDKYGTIELIAFLTQMLTQGGFYSEQGDIEFIRVEGVSIAGSITPSTTPGRHPLPIRFTSIVHVAAVDYPANDDLHLIYSTYMGPVINHSIAINSINRSHSQSLSGLSHILVDLYFALRQSFSVDDHRHYLFTPRDLTNLCRGLLRYDLTSESLITIFLYESRRVFRDRLVDEPDRHRYDSLISDLIHEPHPDIASTCFTSLGSPSPSSSAAATIPNDLGPSLHRLSVSDVKTLIADGLRRYEREYRPLDLILFPDMLLSLSYIDRVLSSPGGSLLLAGLSGVGRRSSISILSYIRGMYMFSPNVSRSYTPKSFDVDIKDVLRRSGVSGSDVVLYLEDHSLIHPSMLESVNSLLSSGQIPGLFTQAELDVLLAPLRELSADQALPPYDLFVSRVRRHLHIVLSMDPNHPEFLARCTANPALFHKCNIIWRTDWAVDDMRYFLDNRLKSILTPSAPDAADSTNDRVSQSSHPVIDQLMFIHGWGDQGNPPRKLMALAEIYQSVHDSEYQKISSKRKFISLGLGKLAEAEALVDKLSSEAVIKSTALQGKQVQADAALQSITDSMREANERRIEVEGLQISLGDNEVKLKARKSQVELEMTEIIPILDQSREAVGSIRKEALAEMRALRMPPEAVNDVLSGVLMLMGIDDTSWNSMKKLLASTTFKDEIVQFDAHRVTKSIRDKVQSLLKRKESSFDHKTIYRVNTAAAPLAAWVLAQVRYSEVIERIAPLEADLQAANQALSRSRSRLESCVHELGDLDGQVQTLKGSFSQMTNDAAVLRHELQLAQEVLERADGLLSKLQDEKQRWAKDHDELGSMSAILPTKAAIASGYICYLAGHHEDTRRAALSQWSQYIPKHPSSDQSFDISRFLSTESEIISWKDMGLNSDQLSIENAIVILRSRQTPFLIDPAGQGTQWLRKVIGNRPSEVLNNNDPRYSSVVELSVRFGKRLIIVNADGVDPMLYSLLRRDLVRQGPRWVVQIGENQVDYCDDFSMYLVSHDPEPNLTRDANALVNIVNFTITQSGLESQLLGILLAQEEPALEQRKSDLLSKEEKLKIQLADLEKNLLEELATSEGNILENRSLIESLNSTKSRSKEISASLDHARDIQLDLNQQRMAYAPISRTGALLYFLIDLLYHINPMYRFSLGAFLNEFRMVLVNSEGAPAKDKDKPARIAFFVRMLIVRQYRLAAQSLFKDDRLMLALHICHGLYPDLIPDMDWSFFIGVSGTSSSARSDPSSSSIPSWIAPSSQESFSAVQQSLPRLFKALNENSSSWASWIKNSKCDIEPFPTTSQSLTQFDRLIIMSMFRPDKLNSSMTLFASQTLQVQSLIPPSFAITDLPTSNSCPVLFVISPGVDPTRDIEGLAHSQGVQLVEIAMGQGQTDNASNSVIEAASKGSWVCLKNLHLVIEWLTVFEKVFTSISSKHERFRLWLTSEVHDRFPPKLLQICHKITVEAPPGIKRNLLSTYGIWSPEYISRGSTSRARILFILAWFHAIVQERRIYIPQGWSKFYEFSLADLRAGSDIIDNMFRDDTVQFSYPTIVGLMQDAVYGGRIDTAFDNRILKAYINRFFSDDSDSRLGLGSSSRLPGNNVHSDFTRLIRSLPDQDAPSVFGLPDNIEESVQRQRSTLVLDQLKRLHYASVASNEVFNRDKWKQCLNPVLGLWPSDLRHLMAKSRSDDVIKLKPIADFILLEDSKSTTLVETIDSCISDIKDLLLGTGLLTPKIEEDARYLLKGSVPNRWSRQWNGPPNPSAFITSVLSKKLSLVSWVEKALSSTLISAPISLSQLFSPCTFLNAFRQEIARELGQPIDSLKLVCAWDKSRFPKPPTSILQVEGLLLQGASFIGGQLTSIATQAPLLHVLPTCFMTFVEKTQADAYGENTSIVVPLYESTSRESVICQVRLPCGGEQDQWVLSGTSIFITGNAD